jgi:hypothetical protein
MRAGAHPPVHSQNRHARILSCTPEPARSAGIREQRLKGLLSAATSHGLHVIHNSTRSVSVCATQKSFTLQTTMPRKTGRMLQPRFGPELHFIVFTSCTCRRLSVGLRAASAQLAAKVADACATHLSSRQPRRGTPRTIEKAALPPALEKRSRLTRCCATGSCCCNLRRRAAGRRVPEPVGEIRIHGRAGRLRSLTLREPTLRRLLYRAMGKQKPASRRSAADSRKKRWK